jgi:hypothetical protein
MTEHTVAALTIRSVSDRLRPVCIMPGFGESRRSVAKADGSAWGWGPTRTK